MPKIILIGVLYSLIVTVLDILWTKIIDKKTLENIAPDASLRFTTVIGFCFILYQTGNLKL